MKKYLQWIFPGVTYFLAIVSFIVAKILHIDMNGMDILVLFIIPLLLFIFPLYTIIYKRVFSIWLNAIICCHFILGIYGGFIFNLYDIFPWYDLLLHGAFGFICSITLFYVLLSFPIKKIGQPILLGVVFLSTMGVAAMWEIWEYLCDTITGGDAQKVLECIEKGISPVADTMEDLMITVAGICTFILVWGIDRLCHNAILKTFYVERDIQAKP